VAHDAGTHRAVVMVTHNPEAAAATDRVVTLQDGALKADVFTDESPQAGRHCANWQGDAVTDLIARVHHGVPRPDMPIAGRRRAGRHTANRL
jgi:ABC-type nitrate/sulfonate/bicarbonate transport system ATPase subunit